MSNIDGEHSLIRIEECPNCGAQLQAWKGIFDAEFVGAVGRTLATDVPGILCHGCKNLLVNPGLIASLSVITGDGIRCVRAIASDRYLERPKAA